MERLKKILKEKDKQPEAEPFMLEMLDVCKDFQIYPTPGKKLLELLLAGRYKFHDTKRALSNVTMQVGKGTALGLVGQNGSGKSTILKLLAGIMSPTKGEVKVRGKVCAMLDLVSGFNLEFSGRENVYNKCALLGLSHAETEERYDSIVQFSGLGNRIEHPVKTYSSGMLLRLGFSTIIHTEFDILLVDEVLFVGDEVFSRQCQGLITQLKQQGKTIVVSSHSLGQLSGFCEYLLYLDEGVPVMIAPTENVIQEYMQACDNRFTRIDNAMCADASNFLCQIESKGRIFITDVEFVDENGNKTEKIYCNDPLKIRVRYDAEEPVENPCFRVMVFSNNGTFIHGTNTYRQGLELGTLKGKGVVELSYPAFSILEGDYYMNVGIWPDEYNSFVSKSPFDAHEFQHVLQVHSRRPDGGGLIHVENNWSHLKR